MPWMGDFLRVMLYSVKTTEHFEQLDPESATQHLPDVAHTTRLWRLAGKRIIWKEKNFYECTFINNLQSRWSKHNTRARLCL